MVQRYIQTFPTYKVSDDGKVYDVRFGREILTHTNPQGYVMCNLRNEKGQSCVGVHRLVAMTFLPNWKNLKEVDHINRKRDDNRVCNLRWTNDVIQSNNREHRGGKTGEPFITYEKGQRTERWRINITKNYKKVYSKSFACSTYSLDDVKKIRDEKCKEFGKIIKVHQ